jgi:hypothetical protein
MHANAGRVYFRALAAFYLVFGLITTFYPRLMQLFMTEDGIQASSPFSDQVWRHGGFDILSVALLLFVLSFLPVTALTLRAAAVVALMPTAVILYTFLTTPFWGPLFLVPGAASLAFAVYGFILARSSSRQTAPGVVA